VRTALTKRELIPSVEFDYNKKSDFIVHSSKVEIPLNEITLNPNTLNPNTLNLNVSNTDALKINTSNTYSKTYTSSFNKQVSNSYGQSEPNSYNSQANVTLNSNRNMNRPVDSDLNKVANSNLNKVVESNINTVVDSNTNEVADYNVNNSGNTYDLEIDRNETIQVDNINISANKKSIERLPEPFEIKRSEELLKEDNATLEYGKKSEQMQLFPDDYLLDKQNRNRIKVIGQLFETYWLIEFEDKLFIMDQHAAHEKILFEKTMKLLKDKQMDSQMLNPPIILSLNMREEQILKEHMEIFVKLGYEIESFGGKEYKVIGIPANLPTIDDKGLLIEILDGLVDENLTRDPDAIIEKVASMSCKAAVKGNSRLSTLEAKALIDELLEADNPYNCPHGRPTLISMTKYEIEKKFKRIV